MKGHTLHMSKSKKSKEPAHAELSASGSEIWLNCPGSVALARKAPPEKESPYAIEGTKAHTLLEKWATHTRDRMGAFAFPKGTPPGMIGAVRVCIEDMQMSWKKDSKKELVIEKKVYLNCVDPSGDMHGTLDIGIAEHFALLEVTDYKHGAGVKVDVYKESATGYKTLNTQLVYYALAFSDEYNNCFKNVKLKIVQPRCTQGTPISEVTVSMRELLSYIPLFKRGVDRTLDPRARRIAGPWCRWCKGRSICKESKMGYRNDCREDF